MSPCYRRTLIQLPPNTWISFDTLICAAISFVGAFSLTRLQSDQMQDLFTYRFPIRWSVFPIIDFLIGCSHVSSVKCPLGFLLFPLSLLLAPLSSIKETETSSLMADQCSLCMKKINEWKKKKWGGDVSLTTSHITWVWLLISCFYLIACMNYRLLLPCTLMKWMQQLECSLLLFKITVLTRGVMWSDISLLNQNRDSLFPLRSLSG